MGIAGDKYFEVLSGLKAGDQVITGPYNSVRSMADGDAVKIEATRVREARQSNSTAVATEPVPRIRRHRARRDLGGQAPIVHDRARQHRRGDVDHRRGVAHPGAERVGQGGDPEPGRRRLVQHPAVPDHAFSDDEFDSVRATRASRGRRRAIKRYGPLVRAVMLESDGTGAITYRDKSIDSAASPASARHSRNFPPSTPNAAG